MGYIYKITNLINNQCYIGQTVRAYTERWAEHLRDKDKEPYCNWPLYRMINKVGINNIDWRVIEEVPNELLNEREQYWIKYYNSKDNGYNCTYGGYNGTKYNYNEILDYWLNEGERNFTKTAEHFGSSKSYISEIIHNLGYEGRDWSEINKNNHDSSKRQINKIDQLTGKVLKTYNTITEAAQDMGDINYRKTISSICSGHRPTYLGYCWQYKEDIGKPIYLNRQQKIIVLVDYNIEFNTLNECAEWFINNNKTRSTSVKQVAAAIRYGLNHSKSYQGIKLEEKEKVIYSYYE
jgi:group I intron endonuclease